MILPKIITVKMLCCLLLCISFILLPAFLSADASDNICSSSKGVVLDVVDAKEKTQQVLRHHYADILLFVSRKSSELLYKLTEKNVSETLAYCIGYNVVSTLKIIGPFPPMQQNENYSIDLITVDIAQFDPIELISQIKTDHSVVQAVILSSK